MEGPKRAPWAGRKLIKALSIFSLFAALALGLLFGLSRFLPCEDSPKRADAIILLVGSDNRARREQAEKLLRQGYAQMMLIPARLEAWRIGPASGRIEKITCKFTLPVRHIKQTVRFGGLRTPENTHIEIVVAKAMMADLALDSALVVSSPYHLRRIKMICRHVFGKEAEKFSFIPAPSNALAEEPFWKRLSENIHWILSETAKIIWFKIYSRQAPEAARGL